MSFSVRTQVVQSGSENSSSKSVEFEKSEPQIAVLVSDPFCKSNHDFSIQ